MCCLFTTLVLLGPRAVIVIWWLVEPLRWNAAFDTFIVPLLGILLAPWTTLMYVLVHPGGVEGWDLLWVGLAIVADVLQWAGGAWGNRDRLSSVYGSGRPY
jgi:hypothetical protein